MRKTLLIITFMVLGLVLQAQDIIYPKRGDVITGRIVEVSNRNIKYYKRGDTDSVINSMPKALVDSIVYENGVRETLIRHRNVPKALEPRRPKVLSEQSIINNPFKVSAGAYYLDNTKRAGNNDDLSKRMILSGYVSMEKIFARNKLGVKLMPFVGINRMAYGTAIGLTAYPKPYYNIVFHTGPRILFYRTNGSDTYYSGGDRYTVRETYPADIISFMFDVGIDIRINKNWSIDTDFGVGRLLHKTKNSRPSNADPYLIRNSYIFENLMTNARLGLCYKF